VAPPGISGYDRTRARETRRRPRYEEDPLEEVSLSIRGPLASTRRPRQLIFKAQPVSPSRQTPGQTPSHQGGGQALAQQGNGRGPHAGVGIADGKRDQRLAGVAIALIQIVALLVCRVAQRAKGSAGPWFGLGHRPEGRHDEGLVGIRRSQAKQ
jgi:hypothetical protein